MKMTSVRLNLLLLLTLILLAGSQIWIFTQQMGQERELLDKRIRAAYDKGLEYHHFTKLWNAIQVYADSLENAERLPNQFKIKQDLAQKINQFYNEPAAFKSQLKLLGIEEGVYAADFIRLFEVKHKGQYHMLIRDTSTIITPERLLIGDYHPAINDATQRGQLTASGRNFQLVYLNRYYVSGTEGQVWSTVLPKLLLIVATVILFLLTSFYLLRLMKKEKEVSRIKTELIHQFAHEFKTPLTISKMALKTLPVMKENEEIVETLECQQRRMEGMTEGLLHDAVNGFVEITPEELNPVELFGQSVQHLQQKYPMKQISFVYEGEPDVRILTDKRHLSTIIENLLDNAVKYSGQQPIVKTHVEMAGKMVFFHIADEGIGFCPKTAERISQRFFRSPEARKHVANGLGLGLYITQNLVNKLGGHLSFVSEPRKGSTFTVAIPC